MRQRVLDHCRKQFPTWASLTLEDVDFEDPKGFSSYTMSVRPRVAMDPPAAFFRRLDSKENAILGFEEERRVFLELGEAGVAAACLAYERDHRIERFYQGRTLRPEELREPEVLQPIAEQLHRLHGLCPAGLPRRSFFELLRDRWGPLAASVLDQKERFPRPSSPCVTPCDGCCPTGPLPRYADVCPPKR